MPNITFVDRDDRVIGQGTKAEALSKGIIHRIVRIFVMDSAGKLLIQKRAANVAVPNRWDQSAAGHVDTGEDYATAAKRELKEEIGISDVSLAEVAKYYAEETDDGIMKKRFNTLYSVKYDSHEINFDPKEVSEVRWVPLAELEAWMKDRSEDFTSGFLNSYQQFSLHP